MKNINTKVLIGGFVVLVLVLLGGAKVLDNGTSGIQTSGVHQAAANGGVQEQAPDFTLRQAGGNTITLSDYKGEKPVVLDFFATWCPNCRRSMPKLNSMYEKYKDQVEVIGVNLQEDEGKVEQFAKNFDISFPIVMDPGSQAASAYGVRYTNYHVLIDKEGQIAGVVPGDISESQLKTLLE